MEGRCSVGREDRSDPDLRHQFRRLHFEGLRERLDRLQPDRPLSPLNEADVGAVEASGFPEGFLTEPQFLAVLTYKSPKLLGERRRCHLDSVPAL